MSKVKINAAKLNGSVQLPPSKSVAHRALICSFLAGGGTVSPIINSNDMKATTGIIESLKNGENVLNSIESGSTLRFMRCNLYGRGQSAFKNNRRVSGTSAETRCKY